MLGLAARQRGRRARPALDAFWGADPWVARAAGLALVRPGPARPSSPTGQPTPAIPPCPLLLSTPPALQADRQGGQGGPHLHHRRLRAVPQRQRQGPGCAALGTAAGSSAGSARLLPSAGAACPCARCFQRTRPPRPAPALNHPLAPTPLPPSTPFPRRQASSWSTPSRSPRSASSPTPTWSAGCRCACAASAWYLGRAGEGCWEPLQGRGMHRACGLARAVCRPVYPFTLRAPTPPRHWYCQPLQSPHRTRCPWTSLTSGSTARPPASRPTCLVRQQPWQLRAPAERLADHRQLCAAAASARPPSPAWPPAHRPPLFPPQPSS